MSRIRQELLFYSTVAGGVGGIAGLVQLVTGNHQAKLLNLSVPWLIGIVVALLFAVSIIGTWYFRAQWRKAQGELNEMRNRVDPLQLQIHAATWGIENSNNAVRDVINAKARNALMFYVNQDAFPLPDPAFANDNKYLEVTYSYSGSGPLTAHRKQGTWIVIPEDPWLKVENERLNQRVVELTSECDSLRLRIPAPVNELESIDDDTYRLLRNEYPIVWQQRLALKWLCSQPSIELSQFRLMLENHGFADVETAIVQPILANKALVDSTDAKLWIKSGDARKVLTALFRESPLC